MSHLEGNPSADSISVVASSAANSSSVEAGGSAASSAPGSNPVDVGEPPVAVCNLHGGNHGQRQQQELFGHDPATYGRPAKAKAKARVAKSAKQSATAQLERANMVVDVSL